MKKKLFGCLMIALVALNISGCKKSLIELESQSSYSYETYFNNSVALNQAVIATYANLLHMGLWARDYYFIIDLLSYDAKPDIALQGDYRQLAEYTFGSNQAQVGQLWGSLYRMIFRSNVVIDRAAAWNPAGATDQANVKQYVAEVKFLRAYAYFNIVTLWGRAPLVKDYNSMVSNNYPPRASVEDLYAFIEQDLKDASADLPATYSAADLGRVTSGSANALLGKVYLYEKKWADAQTALQKVVQSGIYKLDESYDNLFSTSNQNSKENIFQVMNQTWTDWGIGNQYYMFGGQEAWGGKATHTGRAQEYGFNDWKNTYITTTAVKAFTYPNPQGSGNYTDPRAKSTFYGDPASGGETFYCQKCAAGPIEFPFASPNNGGYRWKKYEYYDQVASYGGPQSGINGQVIRYADVLLMLAESYIQQNNTGTEPLNLINMVRNRVKATNYTALGTQSNAMQLLMRERQVELCGEQNRFFDLIRWGIAKQVLNAEHQAEEGTQPFQDKNVLLPIPDVEKNYNPSVANDIANGWN